MVTRFTVLVYPTGTSQSRPVMSPRMTNRVSSYGQPGAGSAGGWLAAQVRPIPDSCQYCGMHFVIRAAVTAVALAVATWLVPGIVLESDSTVKRVLTLLAVAVIVGIVNAIIKPIVKVVGCVFYVLTLGLIGLVVNGLLLWLSSWVAGKLKLPFHITGFWPAFWGAIIIGVVGWLFGLFIGNDRRQEG